MCVCFNLRSLVISSIDKDTLSGLWWSAKPDELLWLFSNQLSVGEDSGHVSLCSQSPIQVAFEAGAELWLRTQSLGARLPEFELWHHLALVVEPGTNKIFIN